MSTTEAAEIFAQKTVGRSFDAFRATFGRYPTTEEGFAALIRAPKKLETKWKGPYLEGGKIPFDPWGREYRYRATYNHGIGYEVWSLGPDGVLSADDIGNWSN
ncbi:MAG: type II secretion system protein GspG [Verrucomicrobia bacterium]|nr:type II secretion system protein GspG [Verrucomicrobiota bacterium]